MMKHFVETIIGGALGMLALYAVAKMSYAAGAEMNEAEHRYNSLTKAPDDEQEKLDGSGNEENEAKSPRTELTVQNTSERKPRHFWAGFCSRAKATKAGMLKEALKHPERLKMEAFFDGNDLVARIKRRGNGPLPQE